MFDFNDLKRVLSASSNIGRPDKTNNNYYYNSSRRQPSLVHFIFSVHSVNIYILQCNSPLSYPNTKSSEKLAQQLLWQPVIISKQLPQFSYSENKSSSNLVQYLVALDMVLQDGIEYEWIENTYNSKIIFKANNNCQLIIKESHLALYPLNSTLNCIVHLWLAVPATGYGWGRLPTTPSIEKS